MDDQAKTDEKFMLRALALASQAGAAGEVPVGAVVVRDGEVIGEGYNRPVSRTDPTAHAEIEALRQAALHAGNYRLIETTLYVTLEPCAMCAGALLHARVQRLVFGALEPRAGAVYSTAQLLHRPALNHRVQVSSGVCAEQAGALLTEFFRERRADRSMR